MTRGSITDLQPMVLLCHVYWWAPLYLNIVFVTDKLWLAQNSNNRTALCFRSSHRSSIPEPHPKLYCVFSTLVAMQKSSYFQKVWRDFFFQTAFRFYSLMSLKPQSSPLTNSRTAVASNKQNTGELIWSKWDNISWNTTCFFPLMWILNAFISLICNGSLPFV